MRDFNKECSLGTEWTEVDIITRGGNASRDLSVLGVELLCAAWEFVLIVSECLFVSSVLYVVSTLVGVDICIYGWPVWRGQRPMSCFLH